MDLLRVVHLSKGGIKGVVLNDISFSQKKLQHIAIAGETGSGKSTLLKAIAGLVQPDTGEIFFKQEKVKGPDEQLVPGHARIAYLSQHFELPKFLRVEQVLSYASVLSDNEAQELYATCRILHLLQRKTDQLSGGERQRIALARLLSGRPALLLLDEPFSHLDKPHKMVLKSVIDEVSNKLSITCILVSHEPADLLPWADEILIMRNGEIIQQGTPQKVYYYPRDRYVAGLLGRFNLIPAENTHDFAKWCASTEKDLLIRPEHVTVVPPEHQRAIAGKVLEARFLGSHYEMDVLTNGLIFTLKTTDFPYKPGELLYISACAENIRYVK